MAIDYRCVFCFNRTLEKILNQNTLTQEKALRFTNEMMQLFLEKQNEYLTPHYAQELHFRLKQYSQNIDPYLKVKKQSNDLVLSQYNKFKQLIDNSGDSFDTGLRLAIAGNIIDFAIHDTFDLNKTIEKVLQSDFAINHSKNLKNALIKAKSVLYLGDNNGEIVLDKLFIEHIKHPNLSYAVRGFPIINDATVSDAEYVGLDSIVPIISNGYDAPSTLLEKCSEEFQTAFNNADLIISKGQGNLEGLINSNNEKIFFLLMVKCEVIAEKLKVDKGDFVVTQFYNSDKK